MCFEQLCYQWAGWVDNQSDCDFLFLVESVMIGHTTVFTHFDCHQTKLQLKLQKVRIYQNLGFTQLQ